MTKPVAIIIELVGGNDSANTLVPYTNPDYYANRKRIALKEEELLKINNDLGFHPNLTHFKELFDNQELAVLLDVGELDGKTTSHFTQGKRFEVGHKDISSNIGWIGRAFADNNVDLGDSLFHTASVRHDSTMVKSPVISNIILDEVKKDDKPLEKIDELTGNIGLDHCINAFNLVSDQLDVMKGFGDIQIDREFPGGLGRQLKIVSQVLKSGEHINVYKCSQGGYDTHNSQLVRHVKLFTELNQNLESITEELKENGMWDDALIFIYSEFGRRYYDNASAGTDHGWSQIAFLTGGAVTPGIYGEYPEFSGSQFEPKCDFRTLYNTIIKDYFKLDESFLSEFGTIDNLFKGGN